MRKVGNVASNQIYNPEARKPPVPIDADEVDSAMERFIRQKYIHNVATESTKPRSPGSDEGTPPPLPPKNSTKFGFRSASSIFPLSSRARKEQRAASTSSGGTMASSTLHNKSSRLFESSVDYNSADDADKNLARLRDMGFQDSQRNIIVLKGVNGNLDRAVEALVRLGEGRSRSPAPTPPAREPMLRTTKSMTPLNSSSSTGLGLSLNVPQKPMPERPATSSTTSTNPFDTMPVAQPQTAQSTGSLHHRNPYSGTNNPFGSPNQQIDHINQAFQGLNVSTSQTSFQNNGGMMVQSSPQPAQHHQLSQQYMSPSAPTSPQNYQPMNFQSSTTYPQLLPQAQQPMQTGYNPFFSQPSSPNPTQQGLMVNTAQGNFANNPYARSPTRIASPSLGQIPEQTQTNFPQPAWFSASPQPLPTSANPFFTNMQQQQLQQQQQQAQAQQFGQQSYGQQIYYQPLRHDKASILALYNQPSSTFSKGTAAESNLVTNTPSIPENETVYTQSTPTASGLNQQPRSVSQPVPGSTNPYMNQSVAQLDAFAPKRNMSRDSMNLGMDMAWNNGRHSPDAFASLSARHV
ncbi:Protein gts1 [Conoideocrella luteorostrata]|uniref:Protein gts1 n=1 Tax=Conoideocrella luteorostrata TaxID=1105319 RepID=A0AAJ0CDR8_9HYPO|nr:Protein gts1 [Conoideocrella luteorostrata]